MKKRQTKKEKQRDAAHFQSLRRQSTENRQKMVALPYFLLFRAFSVPLFPSPRMTRPQTMVWTKIRSRSAIVTIFCMQPCLPSLYSVLFFYVLTPVFLFFFVCQYFLARYFSLHPLELAPLPCGLEKATERGLQQTLVLNMCTWLYTYVYVHHLQNSAMVQIPISSFKQVGFQNNSEKAPRGGSSSRLCSSATTFTTAYTAVVSSGLASLSRNQMSLDSVLGDKLVRLVIGWS